MKEWVQATPRTGLVTGWAETVPEMRKPEKEWVQGDMVSSVGTGNMGAGISPGSHSAGHQLHRLKLRGQTEGTSSTCADCAEKGLTQQADCSPWQGLLASLPLLASGNLGFRRVPELSN